MDKSQNIYITGLSLKPHYGFAYRFNIERNFNKSILPIKNIHQSELSRKAKRRIINAMQWLIYLSPNHSTYCKIQKMKFKFKLNFITLTLSDVQQHSDKFIVHKMLRPFLKYLIRKGCTHYIWKAETQDNGNLHFHITTNHYIFWKSIRNKWNQLQHKYGYMQKYFDEHGDMTANSTDVHAVKNNQAIISYMTKYLIKSDRYKKNQTKIYNTPSHYYSQKLNERDPEGKLIKRYIECSLWNASQELSKKKINLTEEDPEFKEASEYIAKNSFIMQTDHGTLYQYSKPETFDNLLNLIDAATVRYL